MYDSILEMSKKTIVERNYSHKIETNTLTFFSILSFVLIALINLEKLKVPKSNSTKKLVL